MKIKTKNIILMSLVSVFASILQQAPFAQDKTEINTKHHEQTALALTIYNNNLALIKDARNIKLSKGAQNLAWRDVSSEIKAHTAQLRSLSHANSIRVLEQNYDFDLLTPQALLKKYIGQKIRVITTHPTTGAETSEEATILSANGNVILQFADRIETQIRGRIVYPNVPKDLRDSPTLTMMLNNQEEAAQTLELTYLTTGLSWRADCVAELSNDEKSMMLNGWITLNNQSGIGFNQAKLQLVAGELNRVADVEYKRLGREKAIAPMAAPAPESTPIAQENLFEYHLYSFPNKTTIANQQIKQISLLTAGNIPITKRIVIRGDQVLETDENEMQKLAAGVFVSFRNEGKNLEQALPKGVVRVYKKDTQGSSQFIGEDNIQHTPKAEEIKLKLGSAFDITTRKKQVDYKEIPNPTNKRKIDTETAYQVEFRNSKDASQTIEYIEPINGDWKILDENQKHVKSSASTASWKINIPANASIKLNYRIKIKG